VIGLVSLLIGWIGVSGTEYVAEQMSFVASGGLFGIFALGVGAALWISADLRDEWRKLDSVEALLVQALDQLGAGDAQSATTAATPRVAADPVEAITQAAPSEKPTNAGPRRSSRRAPKPVVDR
jgi:hypothetical protein